MEGEHQQQNRLQPPCIQTKVRILYIKNEKHGTETAGGVSLQDVSHFCRFMLFLKKKEVPISTNFTLLS
jgi:hypothetical protein